MQAVDPGREELLNIFEYINGVLWRKSFYNKNHRLISKKEVKSVVNHQTGYCVVGVNGKQVRYHRIVWILNYGQIPANLQIDHIDGNRVNNSIENLRLFTNRKNSQNQLRHKNGKLVGCYYCKTSKRWKAQVYYNKKIHGLGYYKSEAEAHSVYCKFLKENGVA